MTAYGAGPYGAGPYGGAAVVVPVTVPSIAVGGWASGSVDSDGVDWILEDCQGWDDVTALRFDLADRPGGDGAFDSLALLDTRVITWSGVFIAPDYAALAAGKATLRRVADALTGGTALVLTDSAGNVFTTHGKRSDVWHLTHLAPLAVQYDATVTCPDPLLYGLAEHTAAASLLDTSGGVGGQLRFPFNFPGGFRPGVGAGFMAVGNAGTATAWPQVTFTGPGTGLKLTDAATGRFLKIASLAAGQFVVLDTTPGAHSVLLNGYSARRDLLTYDSDWFGLPPGPDSLSFTASIYSAASVTVSWRDAWA